MFFTRVGTVIAWLAFVFGSVQIAIAVFVLAFPNPESVKALARSYLGTENIGRSVNQALIAISVGVAIGILCEISRHIAKDRASSNFDSLR